MSTENIDQTLHAVKQALQHFSSTLERSGFASNVGVYKQMAGIVVGQQQWAQAQQIDAFDARFREIAELAIDVHQQLQPYAQVMEQLGALLQLLPEPPEYPLDTVEGKIMNCLNQAQRPQTTTQIGTALGLSNSLTRRSLKKLAETEMVMRSGPANRPQWSLQQKKHALPVDAAEGNLQHAET